MEKVRLGDVCTINGGYAFKSDQFSTEGVPVIRIGNITKVGLIIDEDVCYDENFWNENDSYRIAKNDILIAMSGATVGKSCINNTERKLLLNQRVAAINCDNNINLKYIFYSIDSEKFSKYIMTNSIGCAQPNISLKQIANFEIPAVCVEEQNRIAGELDKVADVINKRKQQLKKLDELVKARFVELFGDVKTNKYGWEKCDFDYVTTKITDGEHGTVPRVEKNEGYLYFMARNITKDGTIDLSETSYIPEHIHQKIYKRCNPEEEDILLVCVGATIGKSALVSKELGEFSMARSVALLKPDRKKVNSLFLLNLLRSDAIQSDIANCAHAAAQAGLYTNMIKTMDAFLPPIELQNQFATFVEQTDKSKLEVQKSLEKLEVLKKALMQKYFG